MGFHGNACHDNSKVNWLHLFVWGHPAMVPVTVQLIPDKEINATIDMGAQ